MDTKISYFYLSKVGSDVPLSVYNGKFSDVKENDISVSPRFGIINADISKNYKINFKLLVVDDPQKIIAEKMVITGSAAINITKENDDFIIGALRIPASGTLTFEIQINLWLDKELIDSKIVYLRLQQ